MNEPEQSNCAEERLARALWIVSPQSCELREERLAPLEEGELLIQSLFSGISRGTESLVLSGRVPICEADRMRGPNMAGDFSFPVKYGYAVAGRVLEGPNHLLGQTVFCLHPHQDRFQVSGNTISLVPDGVPVERVPLAANMETALNVIWDAHILPGDRVAVFGAGVVGSLIAYLARRIIGTEVTLIDPSGFRQNIAQALDVSFAAPDELEGEYDILINSSASGEALQTAIQFAGVEAKIVEASWYGDRQIELSLGGAFHSKRLSLVSSQVGAVPANRASRWSYARRLSKALSLLTDSHLDCLISGQTPFDDIAETYPAVLADPSTLCHLIRY